MDNLTIQKIMGINNSGLDPSQLYELLKNLT